MNYLLKSSSQESRKRNSRRKLSIILAAVILTVFILSFKFSREILFGVSGPLWSFKNFIISINSENISLFRSKKSLIQEIQNNREAVDSAEATLYLNEVLARENEELKNLLGRKEVSKEVVLASVLSKPPQTPYDNFIIDAGSWEGVKIGDRVLADGITFIGEISEVYNHTSKIRLYSSPDVKQQVTVGASSVAAEAIGVGGGNFKILLPKEIEIRENDVIVMPSITPNVFGVVERVSSEEKDSFQKILFKSPINIFELRWVEVAVNKK